MLAAALILAAQVTAPDATPPIAISVRDGRVTLVTHDALLPDVLERLGAATGMKVRWDFTPPRPALNLDLKDRTLSETVMSLLDGLGLNYALRRDPTGEKVEELLLLSAVPPAADFRPPLDKEQFRRNGQPRGAPPQTGGAIKLPPGARRPPAELAEPEADPSEDQPDPPESHER